ncbi:MAG: ABC transporter permease [Spirochaetales bacterium]|nr:MAG: ABC transporter permease [Spirochaetales bacterium]
MANRLNPVIRKELKSYFNSPIAYIAVIAFVLFSAVWLFFLQQFLARNTASLRAYFSIMPMVFIVLIPALTMRSWAEEKKLGTDEILLTLPFKESHVVLGKFFATFILVLIMAGLTLPMPITLNALGRFEAGEIIGQYLGLLLLAGTAIALGQFISSVATNQISAFIFSVVALLFITLVGQATAFLNLPGWLAAFFNYISLDYHFGSFEKGLLDSRDFIYFLLFTAFFLYLNMKVLALRKWK